MSPTDDAAPRDGDTPTPTVPAAFETPEGARGCRQAPPEVWARARADYLSGLSAAQAAARHGLSEGTLRGRATRERWRRIDQPWPEPGAAAAIDDAGRALEVAVGGDLDRIEPWDLAEVARARMVRAVLAGDGAGALRWRRLQAMMEADHAALDRLIAEDEAEAALRRAAAAAARARACAQAGCEGCDGCAGLADCDGSVGSAD